MSRPWWLPPQKGTEEGPTTRPPPKLVTPQVAPDDKVMRDKLIAEYGGRLNQFYLGQARLYALSPAPQQGKHLLLPDAKLSYYNNQGMETVRLEVAPQKLEQIKEQPVPPDQYDWALIEISVPDTGPGKTFAYFASYIVLPRLMDITPDTLIGDARGVANERDESGFEWDDAHHDPPVIAYVSGSETLPFEETIIATDGIQQSSLRIDLRPFRGLSAVAVDLWGYLDPQLTPVQSGSFLKAFRGRRNDITISGTAYFEQGLGPVRFQSKGDIDEFFAQFPELSGADYVFIGDPDAAPYALDGGFDYTAFQVTDGTWDPAGWAPDIVSPLFPSHNEYTYYPDGSTKTFKYGAWTQTDPPEHFATNSYSAQDDTEYWMPEYIGRYIGPILRDCKLSAALLKGARWSYTYWDASSTGALDFMRFEVRGWYPRRPPFVTLTESLRMQDINPAPSGESVYNHFGMRYLGRVTIDQVHWSVSFKPA